MWSAMLNRRKLPFLSELGLRSPLNIKFERATQKGARKTDRSDGKAAREKGKKFRALLPSSFQFPLTREPFYSRINMLYFSMLNAFTMVLRATVTVCERYTTA